MAMQLDSPESPVAQQSKQIQEKENRKREKKKRSKRTEEHSGQTSPRKKPRPKSHLPDLKPTIQASEPLETTETSPFFEQTSSLYLPLSPICQQYPLQGICAEHLSPLILTFYPPLNGVVLSYSNPRLSERPPETSDEDNEEPALAQSVNEYAVSYVWVTADFLLFGPQRGSRIEGWINLQNEGNIGLVCYNFFNASIERKRLPKEWKWIHTNTHGIGAGKPKKSIISKDEQETSQVNGFGDGDGHFVDGKGRKVEGSLTFTVKTMEASRTSDREQAFVSIEGTMLGAAEEKEIREQDFARMQGRSAKRLGAGNDLDHTMAGAVDDEIDGASDIDSTSKLKHRMV